MRKWICLSVYTYDYVNAFLSRYFQATSLNWMFIAFRLVPYANSGYWIVYLFLVLFTLVFGYWLIYAMVEEISAVCMIFCWLMTPKQAFGDSRYSDTSFRHLMAHFSGTGGRSLTKRRRTRATHGKCLSSCNCSVMATDLQTSHSRISRC